MKRTIVFEVCMLLVIGVGGVAGGFISYINRDARTQSSVMAPGMYILVLGVALMLTALVYIALSARRAARTASAESGDTRAPWISPIVMKVSGAFAAYAYLIQWIGYVVPTILFLLVEFRLLGVKSWKGNIVLTAVVAAIFYVVFIRYCEMVFPHGTLLE